MRNPLIKRIPKELASDWHKYLVIILFMVGMIGVISGMYVGRESMVYSINKGKTELNLEDGCFELSHRATPVLRIIAPRFSRTSRKHQLRRDG